MLVKDIMTLLNYTKHYEKKDAYYCGFTNFC